MEFGLSIENLSEKCKVAMSGYHNGGIINLANFDNFVASVKANIPKFLTKEPIYSSIYRPAIEEVHKACNFYRDFKPEVTLNLTTRLIDGQARLVGLTYFGTGGSPFPGYIDSCQYRYLARALFRLLYPVHEDLPIVLTLGRVALNKKRRSQMLRLTNNWFVRELVAAFYNQSRKINWWHQFRQLRNNLVGPPDIKIYCDYMAAIMYDAVGYGFKMSLKKEWRTTTVMALIKQIKADESFGLMPILADALQDADCNLDALLTHLRNPEAKFTLGGWIFRTAGVL